MDWTHADATPKARARSILALALAIQPAIVVPSFQEPECPGVYQPVAPPLTELGTSVYERMDGTLTEFTGGLYPDGANEPPPSHAAAGLALAESIGPLAADGSPDPSTGRIVMFSLGMSNTAREFQNFMDLVWRDPDVNPQLSLINGAQGGRTADQWVDPGAPTYGEVDRRLGQQGLTPLQVQVVWIKQTLPGGGAFPDQAEALARDLRAIVRNLAARYPNLKIVFLSSRTRSYLYGRGLSPEPAAYESGFAVKWLIEEQIEGDPELNFDPDAGEVEAPFLAWGPYLWIDGETPRADGRVWLAGDLDRDCVHPSASGARKVAEMLRDFFLADRLAAGWFGNRPAAPTLEPSATYVPSATASQVPSPTPEVATATVSPTGTSAAPRPSGGASTQAAVLIFVGGLAVGLAGGFALGRRRRTTHPQEVP